MPLANATGESEESGRCPAALAFRAVAKERSPKSGHPLLQNSEKVPVRAGRRAFGTARLPGGAANVGALVRDVAFVPNHQVPTVTSSPAYEPTCAG
jgi:hypothetical protein